MHTFLLILERSMCSALLVGHRGIKMTVIIGKFSVSQGSVLGPMLFVLSTSSVSHFENIQCSMQTLPTR